MPFCVMIMPFDELVIPFVTKCRTCMWHLIYSQSEIHL
jgi:hypothetical protein